MVYTVKDKDWKDVFDYKYLYTGEVDLQDNPCGFGTAKEDDDPLCIQEGTFFNGNPHGFGMSL